MCSKILRVANVDDEFRGIGPDLFMGERFCLTVESFDGGLPVRSAKVKVRVRVRIG